MEIRYSQTYKILLVLLGIIELGIGLIMPLPGALRILFLVLGAIIGAAGVRAWTKSLMIVEPEAIVVNALLGPFKLRYPYTSPRDIEVTSKALIINDQGITQKVRMAPWMADPQDWAALQAKFGK